MDKIYFITSAYIPKRLWTGE